jgi:TonB-linked SusC/RagA family outer membrane protein
MKKFLSQLFSSLNLAVFLLATFISQVAFAIENDAQKAILNFNSQTRTVSEVMNEIEKQTEFTFFYNSKNVNLARKVTIGVKNENVIQVLDKLFSGTNTEYKIMDKNIVLSERGASQSEATKAVASTQQNKRVLKGVVVDESGEPIVGATVMVKGSNNGTITDLDGNFSISDVQPNASLVVSYVGYTNQTVSVAGKPTLRIVLKEDTKALDEVVVIGYGVVKKRDLTGSSVSVSGADLAEIPVTNAAQALAGKAAGVNIVSQNGAPGADVNITVRGGTSITQSTTPIYIIDGFQSEDGLKNIDVNDIKTIDILKDASTTAIYGARGSNGVVLITTKSGSQGKTQVNYNGYMSVDWIGKKLDLMNLEQYAQYQYEWWTLAGEMNQYTDMFGGDYNDPSFYTNAYSNIANTYGGKSGIDWQDLIFGGSSITQNHNVSISTGNDKTQVHVSYNNTSQDGIVVNHGYYRNTLRAKINSQLWKHVKFDMNSSFNYARTLGGGAYTGLKHAILRPETGGIAFTDEQLINEELNTQFRTFSNEYDAYNPLITNSAVRQKKLDRTFSTNAGLDIDFLKDFIFRTAGSYTWTQIKDSSFDDGRTASALLKGGPYGSINNKERYAYQWTNTLNWKHKYDKHDLGVMLGQELYYTNTSSTANSYKEFPDTNFGLNDISMATPDTWKSTLDEYALLSVFGRINYTYNDRYLLTATVRADGSSKFASGNRWGYFPSASAAWRVSEEEFWKDHGISNVINNVKLRLGYGTTGNCNVDNYMYTTAYETAIYPVGNQETSALAPGDVVGNNNLKWEKTISTNVGLDLGFFNNRLNLTVDWYNNKSDDLLMKVSIPTSTGYKYQYQNIGSIRNRGLEIALNSLNIKTKDFQWTTDFNISFNRSKVLRIDGENDYYQTSVSGGTNTQVLYRAIVGHALGEMWGYKTDGVYTTDDFVQNGDTYTLKKGVIYEKGSKITHKPGDIKYVSTAGQVDEDGTPVYNSDDMTVIGNGTPDFTGGFKNTFSYKGFDLSVFMTFSYGNDIFNMSTQRFIGPYQPYQNLLASVADRYTLVDPETGKEATSLARIAELNPNQYSKDILWSVYSNNKAAITAHIDRFVEDGSYLRINTITLGYTLPKRLLSKVMISNLRLYCTLNNMFTFTKYSGYDPEVSVSSSILTPGIDDSAYPRSKGFVFGINLSL